MNLDLSGTPPIIYDERTVLVSVSGGRTSAYMAWWMKNNQEVVAESIGAKSVRLVYVFANTGMEHDDTLRFMDAVDRKFDLGVVWVEGEPVYGERKSTRHRIVDHELAFRSTQYEDPRHPFHAFIIKYGIPNIKFMGCTREMKRNAIHSYMRSLGLKNMSHYHTAIGIREDESRRVSRNAGVENIIYPLCDMHPTDKDEVLEWWAEHPEDLRIPEWQGNCLTCYKKSFKKLKRVHEETPDAFNFTEFMELKYPRVGPEFRKDPKARDRVFYRANTGTRRLLKIFVETPDASNYIRETADAGCSESCELFPTEAT